jgi:hypothetical protein
VVFLAGAFTASVVCLAALVALVLAVGPRIVSDRVLGQAPVELPGNVLEELVAVGAVVENAGNPTGAREHDTLLVRPHPELGYELRPGARIDAYMLAAEDALNLDPPVIYLPAGAALSPTLRGWLDAHARRAYRYEVGPEGRRQTLPPTRAEAKILMVGDSALFGIGVDDEHTIASWLQQLVGDEVEVVNAGVGGYDAARAIAVARRLSDEQTFRALVYVAHHNDFRDGKDYGVAPARSMAHELAALADRFEDGVVVATVPYLEWVTRGLWQEYGFPPGRIATSEVLWRELPGIVEGAGFRYVDGVALIESSVSAEGSVFAPLGLYADHGHLSPRGNRLLAERIHEALRPDEP